MKRIALALVTASVVAMSPAIALADGAKTGPYGEVVKKPKVETPSEKVVHKPVDAGLEDVNWLLVAAMLVVGGVAVMMLSKVTDTWYWLD